MAQEAAKGPMPKLRPAKLCPVPSAQVNHAIRIHPKTLNPASQHPTNSALHFAEAARAISFNIANLLDSKSACHQSYDLGLMIQGLGFMTRGLAFGVSDSGLRVSGYVGGLGFRDYWTLPAPMLQRLC